MSDDDLSILDRISVDDDNNLLWDGQKVQTEQKIVFGKIASAFGVLVATTTIITSILMVFAYWNYIDDNYRKYVCPKFDSLYGCGSQIDPLETETEPSPSPL